VAVADAKFIAWALLIAWVSGVTVTSCGRTALNLPEEPSAPDSGMSVHPTRDAGTAPAPAPDAGKDSPLTTQADPCRGVALPSSQHYVPQGLCARLVASNLSDLRAITFAPDGELFGVTKGGKILRLFDSDGDGFFEPSEVAAWADTGGNGNNCHVDAGGSFLYAGTPNGVQRWPYAPMSASGGPGDDVVVGMTSDGWHHFHNVHVYDGYLYVTLGSAANEVDPMAPSYDLDRAVLRRFPLVDFVSGNPFSWSSGEVVTSGLRNTNGYARHASGILFGVVNGMDNIHYQGMDVHEDNPGEQVVRLLPGMQYGYPFCFTAQRIVVNGGLVPPGTQLANPDFPSGVDDAWCNANSSPPATFVQAHSAPLDITFFDTHPAGALPERWRGGAFITMHGSWDRSVPTGHRVVWMAFDAQGNLPMPASTSTTTVFPYEVVFSGGSSSGPLDGAWSWGTGGVGEMPAPVGVAISPVDGALYVSSDASGVVYRIGEKR
jgi:glucose/arabinose dehydrogenase